MSGTRFGTAASAGSARPEGADDRKPNQRGVGLRPGPSVGRLVVSLAGGWPPSARRR